MTAAAGRRGVVAIALLALVGCGIPTPSASAVPTVDPSPVATSSASSSPPSSSASAAEGDLRWQRTSLDALAADGYGWPRNLSAADDGFLMIADRSGDDPEQAIARSADGLDWQVLGPVPFAAGHAGTVASDGERPFLLARSERLGLSTWDGSAWVDQGPVSGAVDPTNDGLGLLTWTAAGWFAVAVRPDDQRLVRSDDARTWQAVTVDGAEELRAIEPFGRGMAIAWHDPPLVSRSDDGVTFVTDRVDAAPDVDAWDVLDGLAVASRGMVVTGTSDAHGAIWWSREGTTWTQAIIAGPPLFFPSVTTFRDAFVALGTTDGANGRVRDQALWASPDGQTWARIHDLPDDGTEYVELAANADAVVVMGQQMLTDGRNAVVLWTGRPAA